MGGYLRVGLPASLTIASTPLSGANSFAGASRKVRISSEKWQSLTGWVRFAACVLNLGPQNMGLFQSMLVNAMCKGSCPVAVNPDACSAEAQWTSADMSGAAG